MAGRRDISRIARRIVRRRLFRVAVFAASVVLVALSVAVAASPPAPAGSVFAFGSNVDGQLGGSQNIGMSTPNATPTLVVFPGENGTVTEAAAGQVHSLVVTSSGQLYAFGSNYYGELGTSAGVGTGAHAPTPTLVVLPAENGTVTQAAAGQADSFVVTSSGQLYAFGENYYGELGSATGNGTGGANPTPTLVALPGQSGPVTQIAAGVSHTLAATSSGQLYAFGLNLDGQLGIATHSGTTTANPTPTLVTLPGQIGVVTQLAAGTDHSLVVTSSGQLYAFGDNQYGELGSTTHNGTGTPNPTPTLVALPGQSGTVTQVATGEDDSLVVTSSGQLYAFGLNLNGELGNATNSGTTTANPTPTLVTLPGQIGAVTHITAGENHSVAVTSSGQLYAFGDNAYGELGSAGNSGTNTPSPPTLVTLPAGTTIDAIAKGTAADHVLAIVSGLSITSGPPPNGQVGVSYSATSAAAGGAAALTWSASGLPPGLSINAQSAVISGTPSVAGSFSVVLTVTDSDGTQASQAFTLVIAPVPCPSGETGISPSCHGVMISALKQSASKWREGNRGARISKASKQLPVGTTFSFTLSEAAKVTFAFTNSVGGRKVGKHCDAQSTKNATHRRCTRTLTYGTLKFTGQAGINKVKFAGRLSKHHELKARSYTLVVSATASQIAATPRRLKFTIVAP